MTYHREVPEWHPEARPLQELPGIALNPDALTQLQGPERSARIKDTLRKVGDFCISLFDAPGALPYMPPYIPPENEDPKGF